MTWEDRRPDDRKCKAMSKQKGVQCGHWTVLGKEVCRYHGGLSLEGIASPNAKDLKYSKALPKRMLARYREALKDETALHQKHEIAMVEARIEDLIKKADEGVSYKLLELLRKYALAYQRAWRRDDAAQMASSLTDLFNAIERDWQDYATWDDIKKWVTTAQRLRESERKRLLEEQQMMRRDEVMGLMHSVAESVKRHVTDPEALRGISLDIGKLLNAESTVRGSELDSSQPSPN